VSITLDRSIAAVRENFRHRWYNCPSRDDADYIAYPWKCDRLGIDIDSIECEKEDWIPFSNYCGCGCMSPCLEEPAVEGSCEETLLRYSFFEDTGTCQPFAYGGCEGTANNFDTLEKCEKTCGLTECPDPMDENVKYVAYEPRWCHRIGLEAVETLCESFGWEVFSDHCGCGCTTSPCSFEPGVGGPCDHNIPSFTFNPESETCEPFSYGGCRGSPNRFETLEECETTCGLDDPSEEDPCSLEPRVAGTCNGDFPRYTFNAGSGTCEKFSYSGCDGNANNFERIEECVQACIDVPCPDESDGFVRYTSTDPDICSEEPSCLGDPEGWEPFVDPFCGCGCWDPCLLKPAAVGFCEASIASFTFNQATGMCEKFNYSGCGGNDNIFRTQDECEDKCLLVDDNDNEKL